MTTDDTSISNPFFVLDVPGTAGDKEIRDAFHAKVASQGPSAELTVAYQTIKTEAQRLKWKYIGLTGVIAELPSLEPTKKATLSEEDADALICELAFLSRWELGANNCDSTA